MAVSHRTQITLTDEQYELLKRESGETGLAMSELVRQALDRAYGSEQSGRIRELRKGFGSWADRDIDGKEYVERIRRPGLGHRLERLWSDER